MTCEFCLAPLHKGPCQSWETGLAGNRNKQQRKVGGKATAAKPSGTRAPATSKPTPPAKAPSKIQPAHQPRVSVRALLDEARRLDKKGDKKGATKLRQVAKQVRAANQAARSKAAYRRREADRKEIGKILKKPPGA